MVEAARICEEARPDILDIKLWLPRKESSGQGSRGRHATQYPVDAGDHERGGESREHPRHRENPVWDGMPTTALSWIWPSNYRIAVSPPSPSTDVHGRKCTRARRIGP